MGFKLLLKFQRYPINKNRIELLGHSGGESVVNLRILANLSNNKGLTPTELKKTTLK